MSRSILQFVFRHAADLAGPDAVPDADLLRRFAADRDEAAFAALLRRHGPMVWAVCRHLLPAPADAEDAFQATFLALVRSAGAVRNGNAVGGWLHGVAVRVATRAKREAARRRQRERRAAGAEADRTVAGATWDALLAAVHEEVARLPDALRAAFVLCDLEGVRQPDAASRLGWKAGTLTGRLARARRLLVERLSARGLAPAVVGGTVGLGTTTAAGAVPARLFDTAMSLATAGGVVPTGILTLANEVTQAMFLSKLKIGAATLLAAGIGIGVALARTPEADPAQVPVPASEPAARRLDPPKANDVRKQEPTAARKLLDRLRNLRPKGGGECLDDDSAVVLREFIQLGPDAVPDLIAELDATTDSFMLRCMGFAARAVGDKRVVPALIRAFPKTNLPPASDYATISKDAELLTFLQKHSCDKRDGGTHYSFGRPYTEFCSALQRLTGLKHGEGELNFASLGGSPRQRLLQRMLYQRCAERWAAWWEQHWKEFVADERYARVGLPPLAGGLPNVEEFPHGPRVNVGRPTVGCIVESVRDSKAKHVFKDLDTGREAALPDRMRSTPGQPERFDDITAWAAGEGFDIMGTEYTVPGEDKPHYVIRGLGLTTWEIDTDRRGEPWGDHLGAAIRADKPLDMGRRTGGLLARFDAVAGRYRPGETALYLFQTRENGFGWIFVGVEVHDNSAKNGMLMSADPSLDPVSFYKGRRYSYALVEGDETKGITRPSPKKN